MGFTFHKLYARNYKVYRLDDMWIWVSRRVVIFKDLDKDQFDKVFQMIISNTYPLYEEIIYLMDRVFFDVDDPKMCIMDKVTGEIISHDEFLIKWTKEFPDPIEYSRYVHGSGRFRELILHKRHINLIKELHKRKMLCLKN